MRSRFGSGMAAGLGAYLCWGLSPIFWKQLDDVPAIDTLGWRVLSTTALIVVVITLTGRREELARLAAQPRARLAAVATGLLLATNWGTYVWAVADDRVVEASLGYFINPIVSVFLGVLFLRERLRAGQWAAVALAAAGVAWLTVDVGSLPWVSLVLAFTFAFYGLIRKTAPAGPVIGLQLELTVMVVPAIVVLGLRANAGHEQFHGIATTTWLLLTAVITAVPLLLFAKAARSVPLSIVGLLQFLAPTLQFLLGVLAYGEAFGTGRLIGFAVIWAGLAVFVLDALGSGTRAARPDSPLEPRRATLAHES